MRRFTYTIDSDKLSRGLRPIEEATRNSGFLVKCNGAVGMDGVLSVMPDLNALDLSFITDGFPYPQLFVFPYVMIACGESKIYEWNGSQFVEKLDVTGYENSPWAIEASGDFLYLSNGKVVFIRDPFTKEYVVADKLPTFEGVTNYNGQIVIAAPVFPDTNLDAEAPGEGHTNLPWADTPSWGSGGTEPMSGPVWVTGSNTYGELGLGSAPPYHYLSWTLVGDDYWTHLGGGSGYSFLIKEDGTLWAVGINSSGELGLGDTTTRDNLTQVGVGVDWIYVGSYLSSSFVIEKDGSLWATGANDYGQLGLGDTAERHSLTKVGSDTWKAVCGNVWTSVAIGGDGELYATDYLGIYYHVFHLIDSHEWAKVACGQDTYETNKFALAIKGDGTLWGWGDNSQGQLGAISGGALHQLADDEWIDIAAGEKYSIAIKSDGTLWGTGYNNYGQLGLGTPPPYNYYDWTLISSDKWKHVSCGTATTLAIKDDDTLWGCGRNDVGQLGLGDITERDSLTKIGDGKWLQVACISHSSRAIKKTW